jgi:hypothetical protein
MTTGSRAQKQAISLGLINYLRISPLEIFVKSGKDSTGSLSLVINKVRFIKALQNRTQWEVKLRMVPSIFDGFLSFTLSFFFPRVPPLARTCTATIIPLEPCALNAEIQHFILRFNKISLTFCIPLKEGLVRG